jgi:iron-sulfur cluster assembly accessory protein
MEQFAVTDRAFTRIAELIGGSGMPENTALRVAVLAGGCNGLQYKFELDQEAQPDDLVIAGAGSRVTVDPVSLELLAGAELDFKEELIGSYFAVKNPNAKTSCGCGTSFSAD